MHIAESAGGILRITRSITTLVAAAALIFGATAASAGETPAPSTALYTASADVQAEQLVLGPWTDYDASFESLATCNARKSAVLNTYKAKVYGGMDQVRCITREIPRVRSLLRST